MSNYRKQRYEKEIQKIISNLLNTKIRDEKLHWITISSVDLSHDYRYAKVYFSFLNEEDDKEKITEHLNKTSGMIKKEIGNRKMMRVIPDFSFIYDDTENKASHLEEILEKIKLESN
ncbi:MAG: 30S ribosome-binding factor RbfA [Candidatus Cloacimonetes bacterium]|nr:30S ribosome-binding factor RbfA [Candidatus Cloacimonadota bacterium]